MVLQGVLWLLLLQNSSACKDLTCFADYVQTLTCLLGNHLQLASRRAPYSLVAEWNCGNGGNCSFHPTSQSASQEEFSCIAEQKACAAVNSFTVEIRPARDQQRNSSGRGCQKTLLFSANFKPHPPFDLTVEASHDGYNISWKTMYQRRGSYLDGELQYELRYKHRGRPWQEQGQKKPLLQDIRSMWLYPNELEDDSEYEVQVRAGPREQGNYQGTWSEWSSPVQLRTLPKAPENEGAQWLVPLLLLLSLLGVAVVFRGCHERLWKKLDIFIPSPVPFFQPLYLTHHGDFKEWVGASRAQATLDIWEWSTVLPEVFQIRPPSPSKAMPPEHALPHLMGGQQAPHDSHGLAQEQTYGHISINTVTVAGGPTGCCPHGGCANACCALEQWEEEAAESQDVYRGMMDLDGGSNDEDQTPEGLLLEDVLLQSHSLPSGSESPQRDSPSVLLQVRGSLGRKAEEGVTFFGWPREPWNTDLPLFLSSPGEERLIYSNLLSPDGEVDGDLGTSLDLDTIDSGFVDSDCASPVDCEFEEKQSNGCGAELGPEEGEVVQEDFLPSYVKQWISCYNRTPPS